ncbi:MAG: hypothetical protein ABR534_16755, partial [Desulfotignum sp.]
MLKNVSLAKKIAGGFVVILVLLVVIAIAGRMGLTRVVTQVERADEFQVMVARILDARQNEKQFILTSDPAVAAVVEKDIQALETSAGKIAQTGSDPDIRSQAQKILSET